MVFPSSYGKWPTYRSLINWVLLYLSNMVIFHMLKNRMVFFSLYWPSSVVGPVAAKKQMRLILRWHLANPLEMEVFYWGKLENIYKWWIFRCSIAMFQYHLLWLDCGHVLDFLLLRRSSIPARNGLFYPMKMPSNMHGTGNDWLVDIHILYIHIHIVI